MTRDGKTTREVRNFITSVPRLEADAGTLRKRARGHSSIENRSHDVRDLTMAEDASQIRKGSGPQVMAAIRNATIGLLRLGGATNIAAALRRNGSRVGELLTKLGVFKKSMVLRFELRTTTYSATRVRIKWWSRSH